MFQQVLREMIERVDGSVAALLMGFDGIAIESYVRPDAEATSGLPASIETVGMEYSAALQAIRTAAEMLRVGEAREVLIRAEHMTTVIRLLNSEYFAALTLGPGGNSGKAGFVLRTQQEHLLAGLS